MVSSVSYMTKLLRELKSEHVIVKVGRGLGSQEFSIPKDLFCSRSGWFKTALKENRFQEGQTKSIELPEDVPEVFELFHYYIHEYCLTFTRGDRDMTSIVCGQELLLLAEAWAFGDRYLEPKFQDCSMQRFCNVLREDFCKNPILASSLAAAFRAMKEDSPVRTALADHIVYRLEVEDEDFNVKAELVDCPGFLRCLHESEAVLNRYPRRDFPRYCKPGKFLDVLYVKEAGGDEGEESETFPYNGSSKAEPLCQDCEFTVDKVTPQCRSCETQGCQCGAEEWALICDNCLPPEAES